MSGKHSMTAGPDGANMADDVPFPVTRNPRL